MIGSEVNPVIRALRGCGIAVTALRRQLTAATPRLFFMTLLDKRRCGQLATTLRHALEATNVKK